MDQLEASYIDVYNLNVYPNTEFYHLIEEDVFSSKAIFRSRNSNVSTNYSVYGGTRVSSGSSEYFFESASCASITYGNASAQLFTRNWTIGH